MRASDRFTIAISALRDNRRRTLLSIFGIMIGVISVIIVSTISKGGGYIIFSELETFGLTSIWVHRNFNEKDPNRRKRSGTGIDRRSYLGIKENCCSAIKGISAIVYSAKERVIHSGNNYSNAHIIGVDRTFMEVANEKIAQGRPFREQDINSNRGVAIIGEETAIDLFGNSSAVVGNKLSIGEYKLIVIGVLERKSREFLTSIGAVGGDINNRILIPYTLAFKFNGNNDINRLQAKAITLNHADIAGDQIIQFLSHYNNKKYSYKKETMAGYIKTADSIISSVSVIGIIAASVSLLVGGMGIMSMMSTAVLERTREIGLRKAIGASKQDILFQYLMEATFISIVGGILGLVFGIGGSMAIANIAGFPAIPATSSVKLALSVSVVLGILSGYLPARRAALKAPVEALRYE